ncbi:MAG TPA: hypothetical protein VFO85_09650, partial [Vicinamibacteria bacterium]|nr:hypothetical protein [Vicinamibacteria bacterium]
VLPLPGTLEVEARGAQVSVRAHKVPLSRILDRLAQQTGMKVTYDASPPSQTVTATFEHLPVRDAVVRLMEGLSVAYVFRTDVSGQRVETLLVTEGSGSPSQVASSSSGNMGGVEYPAEVIDEVADYQEPPVEISQPVPGEMPPPQPGMPAPDLALPGAHRQGIPQFPGSTTGSPSYPNQPEYPGPISYPN